jgi:beta-fructofuranosidase
MTYQFHFAPQSGWMNDPNGLIFKDGLHHLFFQYNPDGLELKRIHWGHAVSTDLVSWQERPIALVPGDAGDYDDDGCYSGCAVPLPDGRTAVVYSGNHHGWQLPCLAIADDPSLDRWSKSVANPVIAKHPEIAGLTDFRDHCVQRVDGHYRQIVAAGAAGEGLLLEYPSNGLDLVSWGEGSVLLAAKSAGLPGEVWECPDIFPTGDQETVLLSWYTAHGRAEFTWDVIWVSGSRDETGALRPERYGRVDIGNRLYAPQSYSLPDGRRIMFAWLQTHRDPGSAGQPFLGAMSMPREVALVDGVLHQRPAQELAALRRRPLGRIDSENRTLSLDPAGGGHEALEIRLSAAVTELRGIQLELSGEADGFTIDFADLLQPSRWERYEDDWVPVGSTVRAASVYFDHGLVEVFFDDGTAAAMSHLSTPAVRRISMKTLGAAPHETTVEAFDLLP